MINADYYSVNANWRSKLPEGIDLEQWLEGRNLWETGHTSCLPHGGHYPHELFLPVAHYLFFGDKTRNLKPQGYGREQQRAELLVEWLIQKYPIFSSTKEKLDKTRRVMETAVREDLEWAHLLESRAS